MIKIFSHGFKYGQPEANFIFDVSYFKNPWRYKNKEPKEVIGDIEPIVNAITLVIFEYYKKFKDEDLRFAICCSAGEYRSPIIVKEIHNKLLAINVPHTYDTPNSRIQETTV